MNTCKNVYYSLKFKIFSQNQFNMVITRIYNLIKGIQSCGWFKWYQLIIVNFYTNLLGYVSILLGIKIITFIYLQRRLSLEKYNNSLT